jgi:hypothetical protein
LAHHPFAAEYDWKKPVTITGTVTKFDWKNPHSSMAIKGKDETGAEGEWTVELGSPSRLGRLGWRAQQFKAGDHVTVDGWLAKNGKKQVNAKSVTPQGGQELAAGSSLYQASEQNARASTRTRGAKATSGQSTPTPRP